MARLRPVTGYKGANDWTIGISYPDDDGIFKVDISSGNKKLLVSFKKIAQFFDKKYNSKELPSLFINHTLWNREDNKIFFFARAGWSGSKRVKINQPFIMNSDGSELTPLSRHIGAVSYTHLTLPTKVSV